MNPSFEESFDFDLNFIQHPVQNVVSDKKLRKAVLIAKKKTIATDTLIKKYFAKKEYIRQTELILFTAKEECKRVCIDYKNALEKCTGLEKEVQILNEKYKTLESEYTVSQNQYEAIKSHANQLQSLVKENELKIESLQVEKQHTEKKKEKDSVNVSEKSWTSLKKQNENLLSHILILKDIVLGKRKLQKHHKVLLRKYKKPEQESNDECNDGNYSSDEADFFDVCSPPALDDSFQKPHQNQDSQTKTFNEYKENINDPCITIATNGVQESEHDSEDTGRGSSLAFSDGGKFFNSPDYYAHDSPHIETEANKVNATKFADASTSTSYDVEEKATSPLMFDDEALSDKIGLQTNIPLINSPEYFTPDVPINTEVVTIKEKLKLVDSATSPIQDVERIHVAVSPISFVESDLLKVSTTEHMCSSMENTQDSLNQLQTVEDEHIIKTNVTSKIIQDNSLNTVMSTHCIPEISSIDLSNTEVEICDKNVLEKICLEKHNSDNLTNKCNDDTEIEMILSSMRLDHRLLTPIPQTPSRSREKANKNLTLISPQEHNCIDNHIVCPESLKLREESKELHKKVATLTKDVINIKSCLDTLNILPFSNINNKECTCKCVFKHDKKNMRLKPDAEDLDRNTVNNLGKIIDTESIQSLNQTDELCATKNNNKNKNLFDAPNILQTNDDENLPLSEIIAKDYPKPNLCRSISYKDETCKSDDLYEENNESNDNKRKINKHNKKLSKLQKLRHKMLPKYKIAEDINKTLRKKLKPVVIIRNKPELDKILNNKLAYEKAIKIMAVAKKKSNVELNRKKIVSKQKRKSVNNENDIKYTDNNSKFNLGTNQKDLEENVKDVSLRHAEKNDQLESNQKPVDNSENSVSENNYTVSDVVSDNLSTLMKGNMRATRSRSKLFDQNDACTELSPRKLDSDNKEIFNEKTKIISTNVRLNSVEKSPERKRLKRSADEITETVSTDSAYKRILRSSKAKDQIIENMNANNDKIVLNNNISSYINSVDNIDISSEIIMNKSVVDSPIQGDTNETVRNQVIVYSDLDLFSTTEKRDNNFNNYDNESKLSDYPKNSILCKMIDKYGKKSTQYSPNKVTEQVSNSISNKLEEDITNIIQLPADKSKQGMNKLVEDIQKFHIKSFMIGFIKYLKKPARKQEMFKVVNTPPAPPMTKAEQILLYIVKQLKNENPDIVNIVLTNIEFTLFQLNRTPDFDVVESMSHFYALVCRYFRLKNRLRLFLLDAMYCLSFKVVTVVKQCLDVWMHILPLAHMGIAKSPLVTCLVYLLHFYKCEDKFKRIEGIRFILHQKYFYRITEWTELKMLEMFKNAVKEIHDILIEKKILRMALIILAKRQGAAWCQKNIIKNMLLPIIEKEKASNVSKQFAVSMLGPLLKPYPMDMKVHCEIIVNQLLDMLDQNPSDAMKEAIFTSLIYMNKHNQFRVTQALLIWEPKQVSLEFEELLKDFVREKPVKTWTKLLPKMLYNQG